MSGSCGKTRRAPEVFRLLDTDHDGLLSVGGGRQVALCGGRHCVVVATERRRWPAVQEDDLARGLRDLGVADDQIVQIVDALDADDSGGPPKPGLNCRHSRRSRVRC